MMTPKFGIQAGYTKTANKAEKFKKLEVWLFHPGFFECFGIKGKRKVYSFNLTTKTCDRK